MAVDTLGTIGAILKRKECMIAKNLAMFNARPPLFGAEYMTSDEIELELERIRKVNRGRRIVRCLMKVEKAVLCIGAFMCGMSAGSMLWPYLVGVFG